VAIDPKENKGRYECFYIVFSEELSIFLDEGQVALDQAAALQVI
jgi:hypothetical protein